MDLVFILDGRIHQSSGRVWFVSLHYWKLEWESMVRRSSGIWTPSPVRSLLSDSASHRTHQQVPLYFKGWHFTSLCDSISTWLLPFFTFIQSTIVSSGVGWLVVCAHVFMWRPEGSCQECVFSFHYIDLGGLNQGVGIDCRGLCLLSNLNISVFGFLT